MTLPTESRKKLATSTIITRPGTVRTKSPRPRGSGKYAPTQTVGSRNKPEMTKAEMYEDLRKAVENTK